MTDTSNRLRIIDSHTHLDEPAFDGDRDMVISASREAGVDRFINIAYMPQRWRTSSELRTRFPQVAIAIGIHPQSAATFTPTVERELERAVSDLHPVAIGETGFDLARAESTVEQQRRAFQVQIALAHAFGLPLVIHQRNASELLIAELDSSPGPASIVLHSFDGTPRLADWAGERGCYIGIGGLATRDSSAALRDLIENMSIDRLLLETDSPYLAPPGAPRRNTPAALPRIAERLAPLWDLTQKELCSITSNNAVRVFGLVD